MPHTHYLAAARTFVATRRKPPAARQRGYSLIEIAFGVAIVAAIAVVTAVFIGDVNQSLSTSQALTQINTLVASARQYRSTYSQGGLYTDISMQELEDEGYSTAWMDGGNALNVYGMAVTLAGKDSNKDAGLTYATPSEEECKILERSFEKGTEFVNGIKAASCSSAGVLSLDID